MRKWKLLAAGAASISLSGCAALDSTHFAWPGPGKSQVISVDASLRNTMLAQDKDGHLRFCSENGPRAITASSSSLAGILGIGPGSQKVEGASAYGRTVASLEYTQTVNLLQASLYRTCELWASGALTNEQLVMRSARDHRSMVAVLAIEQMTGVVKPESTIISGPEVQASLSQSEELTKLLVGYDAERIEAKKEFEKAKDEYDALNKLPDQVENGGNQGEQDPPPPSGQETQTPPEGEVPPKPPENNQPPAGEEPDKPDNQGDQSTTPPSSPAEAAKPLCENESAPSEALKEQFEKCADAKKKLDETKKEYEEREKRVNQVLEQRGQLGTLISGGVSAGEINAGGSEYALDGISEEKLKILASMAENIALYSGVNEALVFCTSYLEKQVNLGSTREACEQVILASAAQDSLIKSGTSKTSPIGAQLLGQHQSFTQGFNRGIELRNLQSAVINQLENTHPSIISEQLEKFEDRIGIRTSARSYCAKGQRRDDCLSKIRFRSPYQDVEGTIDEDDVRAAFEAWEFGEHLGAWQP